MREFELLMPQNLSEALDVLAANDPTIQPLAGGTDMVVDIRGRRAKPDVLVSLNNVSELRGISRDNGTLRIGAATNIAEFLNNPILLEHAEVGRRAAYVFANPMVRNLATVGGNIGSASPAGDLLPPLLALDAQIELIGKNGTRSLPLEDYFVGPRKTARRADELILALRLNVKSAHSGEAFYKLGLRQADAISLISVAVWVQRDGDKVHNARIALGAVAPRPLRAHQAEAVLIGQSFTKASADEAARVASDECTPIDDLRATATYRRRMVRIYVARMLKQAWANAA